MSDLACWIDGPAIAARATLGAMFLRAGAGKLRAPRRFAEVVAGYGLLPRRLVAPVAAGLAVVEAIAALLLLASIAMPRLAPAAGLTGLVLLGLFVGAMTMAMRRGRAGIACGCRTGAAPLRWSGVGATAMLLPLAGLAAFSAPAAPAAPAWLSAQAVLGGLLMLALHDAAGQLAAMPPRAPVRSRRR